MPQFLRSRNWIYFAYAAFTIIIAMLIGRPFTTTEQIIFALFAFILIVIVR